MLNSAAFRLCVLVAALFTIGLVIVDEPAAADANITNGRACTAKAAPIVEDVPITPSETILPVKPIPPPVRKGKTLILEVSGYTSTVGQTDKTPCIGSHLINICARKARGESLCASNVFPIGSKVRIDGLGTCTVADHMARKYQRNIDWYFGQDAEKSTIKKDRAMKIGRRDRKITIISTP